MTEIKKILMGTVPAYDEYLWETSDGKQFVFEIEAQFHQEYLDGIRKICDKCNGSKGEKWWGEDGRLPERFIKCDKCNGKGFLIKTEVWE